MKLMRLFVMAFAAAMTFGAASVPAAHAAGISYGADLGMVSKYVWRGVQQSTGSAVQGDVSAAYGGLTASAWFSNSYASPAPQYASNNVVEADWTLDYSGSYGKIGYELGGIDYTYLYDAASNFPEVYAALSYDALIVPSIKVSYTVADSHSKAYLKGDTWVDLGLSTVLPGGVGLSATYSLASWKKDAVYRADTTMWKSGSQLLTLSMSKDYTVAGLTVTPSLNGSIPLVGKDTAGNKDIYGVQANPEVWVGANIGF